MVSDQYKKLMKEHGVHSNYDFLVGKLKKSLKRSQRYHDFIESQLKHSPEFRAFKEAEETLKNSAPFLRWIEAKNDVEEAEKDLNFAESNYNDEQVQAESREDVQITDPTRVTTAEGGPSELQPEQKSSGANSTVSSVGTSSTGTMHSAFSLLDINNSSPSNQGPLATSVVTIVAESQRYPAKPKPRSIETCVFNGLETGLESCDTSEVETFGSDEGGGDEEDDASSDSETDFDQTDTYTDILTEYDQTEADSGSDTETSVEDYSISPFNRLLNFESDLTKSIRSLVV